MSLLEMPREDKLCSESINMKGFFVSYQQFPRRTKRCFKCNLCKRNLSSKETLRRHILSKHIKLKPHVCNVCGKSFIFEKSRMLHEKNHDVPSYKCVCGEQFKKKSSYYNHKRLKHPEVLSSASIRCTFCHKNCADKKKLRYHLQTRHAPRSIHCTFPSCKKSFPTKTLFNHHIQCHSVERHTCSVCNKTFKLRSYLKRHKAIHKGIRPYECPDCDKKYLNSSHLNTHRNKAHSHSDGYLCFMCGKTSRDKYDMTVHENVHTGKKQFECDLCDYKASFRASLYNHKKKHSASVSATAVESKTTTLRSEAERSKKNIPHYIRVPCETKPFKCLDCNNTFKSAVRANEHWRRYHFVRSEFKCRFCKTVFHNQIHFDAHKRSREVENRFKCNLCSYKTAFRIGLHAHMKNHLKSPELNKSFEKNKDWLPQNIQCIHGNQIGDTRDEDRLPNSSLVIPEKDLTNGVENSTESIFLENTLEIERRFVEPNEGELHFADVSPIIAGRPEPQKGQCKLKTKRELPSSLYSPPSNTKGAPIWEEKECYSFSISELLSEQSLDSVWDLDLTNSNSLGETSGDAQTAAFPNLNMFQSLSFTNSKRRDPKITLNCTAAEDEEVKFHYSHFV